MDELDKIKQENSWQLPESRVLVKDDFEEMAKNAQKYLTSPPVSLNPCGTCHEIHEPGKAPVCICVKCKELMKIVWCGQCFVCAWKAHEEQFGPEVANYMFPDYLKWLKWKSKKMREEGFEWERA